jgi:hypothetical protein
MDLDMTARVYALELLTAQLISESLRTVPDPAEQTKWAREHLHHLADGMPVETERLDEGARLRVGIKTKVSGILETALARAKDRPLRPLSYETGPREGA